MCKQNTKEDSRRTLTNTAAILPSTGRTLVEAPCEGEDLFLYVTDGAGTVTYEGQRITLGQYDVIMATPSLELAEIRTTHDQELSFLNLYLPRFM